MNSELHAWFGKTHCFVGTMNDQTTNAELVQADEEFLESRKKELVAQNPGLDLVVETIGNETVLRRVDGDKLLSFLRN